MLAVLSVLPGLAAVVSCRLDTGLETTVVLLPSAATKANKSAGAIFCEGARDGLVGREGRNGRRDVGGGETACRHSE